MLHLKLLLPKSEGEVPGIRFLLRDTLAAAEEEENRKSILRRGTGEGSFHAILRFVHALHLRFSLFREAALRVTETRLASGNGEKEGAA